MDNISIGDNVLIFSGVGKSIKKYMLGVVVDIKDENLYTVKDVNGNMHYDCVYDVDIMTPSDYRVYWTCIMNDLARELGEIENEIKDIKDRLVDLNQRLEDNQSRKLTLNK